MPAGYTTFPLEVGSTFTKTLELTQSDGVTPLDLTDYTAYCTIRKSYYSSSYVYSLTATIDDPPENGVLILSATAAETAVMKPGRYVFDVVTVLDDVVERILEGIVDVRPGATII